MSAAKSICRLARFGLTTANASKLATFYENAFGFHRIASEHFGGPDFESLMGVPGGADRITLGLGQEIVELLRFEHLGEPYPAGSSASDLQFQHFAIVVPDIGWAWQRLRAVGGWSAITRDAPQRLPETSGGATAFKFRDPEGHPLELLAFPAGNTPLKWRTTNGNATSLGIDHSAISVSDSAASIAFYEGLGLQVSARSFNRGPEQDALDDISKVQVEVTALVPTESAPHLELLCYRSESCKTPAIGKSNDIAATRLVLSLCRLDDEKRGPSPRSLLDPDAHRLMIEPPPLPRIRRGSNDA
jgi:catechol 2,3-dioxygenase-like lactoylglutathione lyase family enzyme